MQLSDYDQLPSAQREEVRKTLLAHFLRDIFGNECWDDSADETARRVLKAWEEFKPVAEIPFSATAFESNVDTMVICRNIEFSSMCAHHLMPFKGVAHVGYLPKGRIIGLSKIPRLVEWLAARPCTQESLTDIIARQMQQVITPAGVGVIIESQHTCMSCRGVGQRNASMVTSAMHGLLLHVSTARAEFMQLALGKI